jgi:hypothetical protein
VVQGEKQIEEAHAKMFQIKNAEASVTRQLQEQHAAEDAAFSDAARVAGEKLKESQQQVRVFQVQPLLIS